MTSRTVLAVVVATAALVLAGCSSSGPSRPAASSGSTAQRPSAAGSCSAGVDYCDTFADPASGWPREQTGTVSAGYTGGSYTVTAYHLATVTEPAPVDIRKKSPDGSVRVTATATPAHFLPPSSLGLGCWLSPGTAAHGGYVFLLDDLEATLSVWDDTARDYRELVKDDAPGALHVHGANRLDAECRRTAKGAEFRLTVNGTFVLGATYSQVTADGGAVGVAVHGARAEVRFDDVAVTGL